MADFSFLCVHQSADLYGSDRVFLQSVKALRQTWPQAKITIHLPEQGLLTHELQPYVDEIITSDLFILRSKKMHWKSLIPSIKKAWNQLQQYDVIYINTVTILSYMLITRFVKKPIILHIHEYKQGIVQFLLKNLVAFSNAKIIANSDATSKAYQIKSDVVLNAIANDRQPVEKNTTEKLNLLLLGRINAWKGHLLAVDAMKILKSMGLNRQIALHIVGDVYKDQTHYRDEIIRKIKKENLEDDIILYGFSENPDQYLANADIILVPSTLPEPFGLVALEGMRASCPIIAADHGGLKEIIVQNETGILFRHNDAEALAEAIRKYCIHPNLIKRHGEQGRQRFATHFTEEIYQTNFIKVIKNHVA